MHEDDLNSEQSGVDSGSEDAEGDHSISICNREIRKNVAGTISWKKLNSSIRSQPGWGYCLA